MRTPHPAVAGRRRGAHRAPRTFARAFAAGLVAVGLISGAGVGLALAELPPDPDPAGQAEDPTPLNPPTGESAGSSAGASPNDSPSPEDSEGSQSPAPEETEDEPADPLAAMAADVVELVNEQRAEAGCGEVLSDPDLAEAATGHSRDMAANDYFDHESLDGRNFSDRAAEAGYAEAVAENIAAGYADAEAVMQGWMDSPGHRDNILNCAAKAVGVGVAEASDGSLYWTQVFGAR